MIYKMATSDIKKIFKSDDASLSFVERMKLASIEKEIIQKERTLQKKAEAEDVIKTVDKFITELMTGPVFTNKYLEATYNTYSKIKVVEIFSFNTDTENGEIYNKELPSATIEGKNYPIRYILNETYQALIKTYIPDKYKPLKELIFSKINTEEYNKGVDIETEKKLIVCIFLYKRSGSKFKNGIYLSRDGIDYNQNYSYNKQEETQEDKSVKPYVKKKK